MSPLENWPNQEPVVSFGLVADIQYSNSGREGSRYYSHSASKLREAINDLNSHNLQFVISLGDLIDHDFSSYDTVMPIIRSSIHPVYYVLGNHEFSVKSSERKKVMDYLEMEKSYYSFVMQNFRFIILDSNDISVYSPDRRKRAEAGRMIKDLIEKEQINAFDYNGGIGDEQKEWFINQLDESVNSNQRVLVFSHHPIFPESLFNLFNYKEMLEIAAKYKNIIAWFCGHRHEGAYANFNLIHLVNSRGMVETPDQNSYAVIELYHNKIWIKGRGREKSMILAY
ncbi:MAG TPA: metallophosphoesterase [Bacteroidales bacterium]|nr:metallophosphoesterase [Bacteroidales bacterium]